MTIGSPSGGALPLLQASDRIPQQPGPLMDYVLTPYTPLAELDGQLHSMSVFFYFMRKHGMVDSMKPILTALYRHLGPNKMVWGIKTSDGKPCIELYFYNHCRNAPGNPMAISTLVPVLAPFINVASVCDESQPYIMCSLELCPERLHRKESEGFRLYLAGEHNRDGYDGVSYLVTRDDQIRENEYCFFYAFDDPFLQRLIGESPVVSANRERLFPASFVDCHSICFSKKRGSVALYFSRVSPAAMEQFVQQGFAPDLGEMVAAEQALLNHLRWDIGYDVSVDNGASESGVTIRKAGLYGYL